MDAVGLLLLALACAALVVFLYGLNLVDRWRYRHLPGEQRCWMSREKPRCPVHRGAAQAVAHSL